MKKLTLCAALACAFGISHAELPTAKEIQKNMGMGFNIGNTMEVFGDPTAWGNPFPTQDLIDSIKAAGFNTLRIPCAWDSHAEGGVIRESWLDSVKTVVDYAQKAGLYTILNVHHEAGRNGESIGWFQVQMSTTKNEAVDTKMKNYWTQIANKFKDYNEKLMFAGANEPGEGQKDPNDPNKGITWTNDHAKVLMGYYQTFIDAVRATGGNNASRTLIIQGPQTDIDKSVANAQTDIFPTDQIADRLMFEVHYYDNSAYTILPKEGDWGAGIKPTYYYGAEYVKDKPVYRIHGYNPWYTAYVPTEKDYTIAHVDEQFAKLETNYIKKGYPVIVGEFGALNRLASLESDDFVEEDHRKGRILWHKDVATTAKKYGITPILWDMGNEGSYDNITYIHRQPKNGTIGSIADEGVINALREVYGISTPDKDNKKDDKESFFFIKKNSGAALVYQNNSIIASGANNASIQLFDVNGNLVRTVRAAGPSNVTMSLEGIRHGMYIAKYSNQTMKISIK